MAAALTAAALVMTCASAFANAATELKQDATGRLFAPVYINDQGPFHFMVDTGANTSGVSRALAAKLALAARGRGLVHATTGAVETDFVSVRSLRADVMTSQDVALPIVQDGVTAGADGILGVDGVKGRRLTIDFESRTLQISEGREALHRLEWSSQRGQVRFGSLVVTPGRIGGVNVQVILDTGAEHSIANTKLAEAMRAEEARRMRRSTAAAVSMAPSVNMQGMVFAPSIVLGDVTVRNAPLDVADLYAFQFWQLTDEPALLLGMDVLRKTRAIAIDYRRGSVHFKYPDAEVRSLSR